MAGKPELLYDHYKDSFEQIKLNILKRERYFGVATILIFTSMFSMLNPTYIQEISNTLSKQKLGIDLKLAFYTINSFLVFFSLWFLIRYFQCVLIIENLYSYIHNIESKLNLLLKDYEISREGKSYLQSYPLLKSSIHFFYFTIYPSLVLMASSIKLYWEIREAQSTPPLALVFDILCLVIIIIMTLLYLSWIHFKDFKKSKESKRG
ncbi:MAG: hypothetical protein O6943_11960 [Bacteroidetes bacterium]|nr:hypothetical protein [Bacteroidota bacterium]